MKGNIKAIIFDWARTLFDNEEGREFEESESVLKYCKEEGYRMAVASLVSSRSNVSLDGRKKQINESSLRNFFEIAKATDGDKDLILKEIVEELGLLPEEILIVDDRTVRGIKYGNKNGHPTVWLKKGRFADELPNKETGEPTYTIKDLSELKNIV